MSTRRTTRAGVEAQAGRLARAARAVGLLADGAELLLFAGSVTNGNAWRLVPAERPGADFLGLQLGRRGVEAERSLNAAALALEAVAEHHQRLLREAAASLPHLTLTTTPCEEDRS